ncbi:hypothetical protein ACZ90_08980 [Streptomyces albus subsp. albus]|nr:hypothetical protein ACZ90_08980 [Streptomyces albus subsp. albus]
MTTYAALLRGINVGGGKRVPMPELRDVLAGLGHTGIATHLQSGNAVFRSDSEDADALGLAPGSRLLTGRSYDSWDGLSAGLFAPLAAGGSVVLCRHLGQLDAAGLAERTRSERVTNTAV